MDYQNLIALGFLALMIYLVLKTIRAQKLPIRP